MEEPIQTPAGYFHGLASCAEWTGVPLATLLDEAGLLPEARWLIAGGADAAAMNISIPVEKALDDTLVALYQNGERIRPENGYPMRLILPGWGGRTEREMAAPSASGEGTGHGSQRNIQIHRIATGWQSPAIHLPDGCQIVHHSPFSRVSVARTGLVPDLRACLGVVGGKIRKVEVSADGGQSWAEAALQEPILSKCFTRFRLPWRWDGSSAHLEKPRDR
jgi:sulfane dehydrogenase subunit SoxC